ncbi:MAG: DUF2065 domain-containing protein [Parvibaculum sp.]|mgnify:CR=1 FL=1|uniref:DUF2065 domain-containing protein n=1 Tax=Parvibaculum sp. TaxID=2024848 RepID=UPI002B9303BE|nr:DUF2065 domain-containing protein [Parvibaculum sp.]HMM13815.1 DUF2065 domain-containing protein [Parvibaculum sp.]
MTELLSALGLVLAIEGALYAAFPGAMRRALASLGTQPDQALRAGGLLALASGVVLVWLVRG